MSARSATQAREGEQMSELMILGFENEMEADRFGLKLAELQLSLIHI